MEKQKSYEVSSYAIGDTVYCDMFIKSSNGRPIPVGEKGKPRQYAFYKTKKFGTYKLIGLKSNKRKELPQIVAVMKKDLTSQVKCTRFLDLVWEKPQ